MELLMGSQETPPDMATPVRDNLHGQGPVRWEDRDPVTVRLATVKGIHKSQRDTQDPLMGRLDLNMDSQEPQ